METLVHLLSVAARVVVIYVFLLTVLRLSGRGTMSQLRPVHLLAMLLLSETVSPAMTAGDTSLTAGLVAAGALSISVWLTSWLSFRYKWLDHALDGAAMVLIDRGKVRAHVLRSQHITDEELRSALHNHGLLSVSQVRKAFVEPDGAITIIKEQ